MNELFLEQAINDLDERGLKRTLRQVDSPQGHHIVIDGRELVNFCSNNYLGLADDPRLGKAAADCIQVKGFGSGASRLVCGNMSPHVELEKTIAQFKGTERCLIFSTGYMANVGIISSLFDRGDLILGDRLNHASLIDGALLSKAEFKRYAHKDMNALEHLLQSSGEYKKRVIMTDSVFSMDGDIAPLDQIVELARRYNALVMVDEAHAFGVLGEKGKGVVEHFGLADSIDIQMGTLSKAAGSFGAYCCGSDELISYLINKARSFIYTTGMPPSTAAASLAAVNIIAHEPQRRQQLWDNTHLVLKKLKSLGFDTMNSQTPIIPIVVKDNNIAIEFSQKLFERGIFISAIRPPTVPQNTARLRMTIMATHTKDDLHRALNEFETIGKELCLI